MFLTDLYAFLNSADLGAQVFPMVLPVDQVDDAIIYDLNTISFDQTFDGEVNLYMADVNFICVSKTALGAMTLSETLIDSLVDYQGLMNDGVYVQDVRNIDQATVYDNSAQVYGVSSILQFTFNN